MGIMFLETIEIQCHYTMSQACLLISEKCRVDFDKLTLAMDSGGGVPSKSVMISNWCTTFFPGNNGLPVSISANMHPMLQISIPGVYCIRQGLYITYTFHRIKCSQLLVSHISQPKKNMMSNKKKKLTFEKKEPHSSGARYHLVAT
jgi:hypothetical protein